MKSREEYEASIFAKRDALLVKRKKNIRMAASAISVVICLGAAAVAIPVLSEKPEEAALPSATNAASGVTENKFVAEMFDEAATQAANGVIIAADNTAVFDRNAEKPEGVEDGEIEYFTFYSTFNTEDVIQHMPATEIAVEDAEGEYYTNGRNFGCEAPKDAMTPDAESTQPSASKKTYTTEEVVEAATKHLSQDDTDKIINNKTNAVVSRKSDGTTSYTVYFYTADKKITVKLSSELELLEIKEKDNTGDAVQISPAYNPNA